jgi:hypothetical protein
MISLITSSTTDPCLFVVIVFFCWKSVLYWWKKLGYVEISTNMPQVTDKLKSHKVIWNTPDIDRESI